METTPPALDQDDIDKLRTLAARWSMTPEQALKHALVQALQAPPVTPFATPLDASTSSQAAVDYRVWPAS